MTNKTYRSRADGTYQNAAGNDIQVKTNERVVLTDAEYQANPGKFDPGTPTNPPTP